MMCLICWEEDKEACKRGDHAAATSKRLELRGRPWSRLVVRTESGRMRSLEHSIELIYGDRHYLDGRPIHCGDALELQHIDQLEDDFGTFTTYLNVGTVVRYEVAHRTRKDSHITERVPEMYVGVGGRSFVAAIDAGCHFRWPERSRS